MWKDVFALLALNTVFLAAQLVGAAAALVFGSLTLSAFPDEIDALLPLLVANALAVALGLWVIRWFFTVRAPRQGRGRAQG